MLAAFSMAVVTGAGLSAGAADASTDPTEPQPQLINADGANDALSGVAQLDGLGPSCTGFLIDSGQAAGPAFLMTNGHCVGLFDSTTIVAGEPTPDGSVARFSKFVDTLDDVVEVPIVTVHYATMRATDVAVVELDATLGSLESAGIAAYGLGPAPADGDGVLVVGVPVNGVASADQVLRGGTCTAGGTTRLVEFEWRWDAAVATDCTGIVGGNSGSPAFDVDDPSTVVGMVNTTTIGAAPGGSCYLGQPCEVHSGSASEMENRTYLMPVHTWAACFPAGSVSRFVPSAPGCPVEPAHSVAVSAPRRAAQPGATWAATITSPGWAGEIAVKAGPVSSTDCRDAEHYVVAGVLSDLNEPEEIGFDEPLPDDEGVYVACATTVDTAGNIDTTGAGYAVMQIDSTAPTADIELVVRVEAGEGEAAYVQPVFAPPEMSSFDIKFGPLDETDCSSPDGYVIYRRVPVIVPAAEQPALVCVVADDEAGNRGDPQDFTVPEDSQETAP